MILAANLGIKAFSTTTMSNLQANGLNKQGMRPASLKFDMLALQYIRILN